MNNTVDQTKKTPAKFGALLGMAPGDVPVYSSHYPSADDRELPNRHAWRSYYDGIFMGYKWQCVEFARRWLYINKGYVFSDVAMAFDIFHLRSVRSIKDNIELPLKSFKNGSKRHPEPGCLLVWEEGGEFEHTGHVAIVTEVYPDRIRLVEQNVDHQVWPDGQQYSREIKAKVTEDGSYWVQCSFGDATILGWMIQTEDERFAERVVEPDARLFRLLLRQANDRGQAGQSWLNIANEDEAAFVKMMGGHRLSGDSRDFYKYLCLSETAEQHLTRATHELHAMFMHATHQVLGDDELLEKFNIPQAVWPKIRQSWNNRRSQMITGRLDFAMTGAGIKLYEYNADSASCYMECGKVQGKWAGHFGVDEGRDPGEELHQELVDAWRQSDVDGVIHIMQDNDLEETYHALFMQEAMERAGKTCKVIKGVSGLSWNKAGNIADADGEEVKWVWKTWAWETALDQLRLECEEDSKRLKDYRFDTFRQNPPRLVDVLLREGVMVYEPLWTLITSNKAILPVLWALYPNHPFLLDSQFSLTDSLAEQGYVTKPIAGRCGANITLVDQHHEVLEETKGRFGRQEHIHQALFRLPLIDNHYIQVCTFSVAGSYAGSCLRADASPVITKDSDILPMRVLDDKGFLALTGQ